MNAAGKQRRNATRSDHRHAAVKRRREQAMAGERARLRQARRRVRRRRVTTAIGIVGVLALVSLSVVLVLRDSDKPDISMRGNRISGRAPEQTVTNVPVSYRISYQIETKAGGQLLVENVTVRRPFDMRYRIADEGGLETPLYDLLVTKSSRTERTSGRPDSAERATPVLLPYGTRLDATLRDLLDNGFFTRRERRRLIGLECTVYRTGASIEGGEVTKASKARHADICFTDDGLVLEEVAVSNGKLELRVSATDLQREPSLTDADFPVITDAAALASGGVVVVDLDTAAVPTNPFWRWATPPNGWALVSRQQVEVAKLDQEATGPAITKASWVDVYTRGNDSVIVRQGGLGDEPSAVDTTNAIDAKVGELGDAKLVIGTIGTKLVVTNINSRFVQLFGTVSASELTTLASSLKLG